MTLQPEQHPLNPQISSFWESDVIKSFGDLCQNEGLNPVRLRRLIDNYIATKRKPSRQQLIDALKRRPRIQERAEVLDSVIKQLNVFIENNI